MMNDATGPAECPEQRVLLLPPTSRDGEAIRKVLAGSGITCRECRDMSSLCEQLTIGAGAVLISEESLLAAPECLTAWLAKQPVWSDLSIIVLSRSGAELPALGSLLPALHNVNVLERPVRISTLLSLVQSGLRARSRQYEVRAYLNQQKQAEEQRTRLLDLERDARRAAEQASQVKDEFLATLSHELRTPLNGILGWSQILTRGAHTDDDLKEGLNSIERNARAQTKIIEDLLDMSRIMSGKLRLDVQRLDVATVVQAAIDTVRPAAQAKGVAIEVALEPARDLVLGDPNRLQQVLWNLLSNAVKFTPRDQSVRVIIERVGSQLEIRVVDNGTGISPSFLPHVFDRFRQADASTTRRHGGLGLGLAIVKQLVEMHGGAVRAMSAGVGKGATFVVSLPVSVAPLESSSSGPAIQGRSPSAEAMEQSAPIAGLKILVVDDEPDSRALVKRLLEGCHANVTVASSAREAMDLLSATNPDLLISDIGMPGEDGFTLINRVRESDNLRGIPAVALTAYARPADRVNVLRAGFQHHLTKPVEPAELLAVIARVSRMTV